MAALSLVESKLVVVVHVRYCRVGAGQGSVRRRSELIGLGIGPSVLISQNQYYFCNEIPQKS